VGAIAGLLAACGPGSEESSSDSADSATAGTATASGEGSATAGEDGSATAADDGSAGGDADGTADDGTADDASDDGGVCSGWDDTPGLSVALQVVNQSDAPIFLQRNGCGDPISLSGPDGAGPTALSFPDCQFARCADVVSGDCAIACSGRGACQETVVRVDPGAVHERAWEGAIWETTAVAAECVAMDCEADCHQQVEATAGTYVIDISYSPCPNEQAADCECPAGEPVCDVVVDGSAPSPMPGSASVEFAYPDRTTPQIVIR